MKEHWQRVYRGLLKWFKTNMNVTYSNILPPKNFKAAHFNMLYFNQVIWETDKTSLGTQTLAPKKTPFKFPFFSCIQQKVCWSNNQWFHNATNYFSKRLRIHKCRQKRKTIRQGRSKRRNCQQKCFNWFINRSFKYLLFLLGK